MNVEEQSLLWKILLLLQWLFLVFCASTIRLSPCIAPTACTYGSPVSPTCLCLASCRLCVLQPPIFQLPCLQHTLPPHRSIHKYLCKVSHPVYGVFRAAGLQVQATPVQMHLYSCVEAWEPSRDVHGGWQINLDWKTGLETAVGAAMAIPVAMLTVPGAVCQ